MSEAELWKATPRKLIALAEVHIKVHTDKEQKEKPRERLTVREMLGWQKAI